MKIADKKLCMRCGAELVEIPEENYVYHDPEEGSIAEFKCPECGTYYTVTGVAEEDREYYPAYNKELEEEFEDAYHGYDGLCPMCGSHIVWSGDFMRSEVWYDTEILDENGEAIHDQWGCDPDDSLVSYVSCPYCGVYIEIVDAKPSELEELKRDKDTKAE